MDPGVRSHGMKAYPPRYLWSKYECFLLSGWWDILHSSCLHVKLWSNATNGTEVRTNIRTDKLKDENYIPLGINARGINTMFLWKNLQEFNYTHFLYAFQWNTEISLWNWNRYCHWWPLVKIQFLFSLPLCHSWKYCFWYSSGEITFDLTLNKQRISSI